MTIGTSGGNKLVGAMTVGTSGGNKAVLLGVIGTAGGNKTFYQSLTASASPTLVNGFSPVTPTVTTAATTATPVGGVGPYTYLWSFVSGDAAVTIVSPTSASTTFQKVMAPTTSTVAFFQCAVTDTATGAVAISNSVEADLDRA